MSSANFGLMYFTNHNPQNFYYVGAIYKIVFDKNMRVSTLVPIGAIPKAILLYNALSTLFSRKFFKNLQMKM